MSAAWYPLSIAQSLTKTALLRFLAYAGLFFAIVSYPFPAGRIGERRFYMLILWTLIGTGLFLALVGLVERVYWNGKILWFFVPFDSKGLSNTVQRATGSFVDPDDFANYLCMIFPLSLAGALLGLPTPWKELDKGARALCGLVSFVIFAAILLSLSRAAWLEAGLAVAFLAILWVRRQASEQSRTGPTGSGKRKMEVRGKFELRPLRELSPISIASVFAGGFLLIILLAFLIVGPQGRDQASVRLNQTITNGDGIGVRPALWKDTLRMFGDFPRFGVGLAAWPEIFPHYQTGSWEPAVFREAHNDYLQYAAETGTLGVLGLLWFALASLKILRSADIGDGEWPIFVALVLAIICMLVHEIVDFCLHIPANAILFTLLLGLCVRLAIATKARDAMLLSAHSARALGAGLLAAALMLTVLAFEDPGLAYPYDVRQPELQANAAALIAAHPANAEAHLWLVAVADREMTQGTRLAQLAAAVWLNPTDPRARDMYAWQLAKAGKDRLALEQVTESVFYSPTLETHKYLDQRIPWLPPAEQDAVENGLRESVAANYAGAVDGLGNFYNALGRFTDTSDLYVEAAKRTPLADERAKYLTKAAEADLREGNRDGAANLLRQAIQAKPVDLAPYVMLVQQVYGRSNDLQSARSVVVEGIKNSVDPVALYLALAIAAQTNGDRQTAEGAMLKALRYDPSFDTTMRVAEFYLQVGEAERASAMLHDAIEMNPESAQAFYWLGSAEEKDYQYDEADRAYRHAAALAPHQFRVPFLAFRQRMAALGKN